MAAPVGAMLGTVRLGRDAFRGGSDLLGEGALLAIRGLGMDCRPIDGDAPDALAPGILALFESMLDDRRQMGDRSGMSVMSELGRLFPFAVRGKFDDFKANS